MVLNVNQRQSWSMKVLQMRKYTHQDFGLTPNFHSLIVLLMALWAKMLSSRSKLSKYSNSAVYRQSHVRPHQSVLSRQCFKVENGKCVLKRSHAYHYQCQQILLITDRKYCDFILYATSGPDSVERIPGDEPLVEKILSYPTTLWTLIVIAPEVFEMRVPRDLNPFILTEPVESLDDFKQPLAVRVDTMEPEEPTTHTSSALPVDEMEPKDPTTCTSSALLDDSLESFSAPITSALPRSLASISKSTRTFPAGSLYSQLEITAVEALLHSVAGPAYNMKYSSNKDQELSIFPSGGLTSTGITLTNTCPLDNWLIIFHTLIKSNKVKLEDLPESGHTIGTAQRLIDDGFYADAKLMILQSLPQWQPSKYFCMIF